MVKDSVKVARHADAPYPAGLKGAASSADDIIETSAAADTPVEDTAAVEQTEGQEG
jgi:large subunit ribosomal protein L3